MAGILRAPGRKQMENGTISMLMVVWHRMNGQTATGLEQMERWLRHILSPGNVMLQAGGLKIRPAGILHYSGRRLVENGTTSTKTDIWLQISMLMDTGLGLMEFVISTINVSEIYYTRRNADEKK